MSIQRDSDTPLVMQVASAIEGIIDTRNIGNNEAIPPERALATSLGVSRTTVRAAIQFLVDRKRLYRVAGSGTYVSPNDASADVHVLDPSINRIVAVSMLELSNPWFVGLVKGIQIALRKQNLSCLLNITDVDLAEEHRFIDQLCRERIVSGLLITPYVYKEEQFTRYERLREAGIPFVFVSHHIPEVNADYVVVDGYAGAYEAVTYLAQLGHRHIAYVSSAQLTDRSNKSRMQGYLCALRDHGLKPMPTSNIVDTKMDVGSGYHAMDELMKLSLRPTAVLAFNDSMAIGAYRRAQEAGLRIPDDLSIIGIDNTEIAATWEIPLTSVEPSPEVLAHHAVNTLLHRIEHPHDERSQKIAIRSNLVVRSSCSYPPSPSNQQTREEIISQKT